MPNEGVVDREDSTSTEKDSFWEELKMRGSPARNIKFGATISKQPLTGKTSKKWKTQGKRRTPLARARRKFSYFKELRGKPKIVLW